MRPRMATARLRTYARNRQVTARSQEEESEAPAHACSRARIAAMWARVATSFTWVYVQARNRAIADKRISRYLQRGGPQVVEYGVKRPEKLVVYEAARKKQSEWSYVEIDGEWWSSDDEMPESVRVARETFQDGLGLA